MTENKIFIERNSPSDEEFFIHQIYVSNGNLLKKTHYLLKLREQKQFLKFIPMRRGIFIPILKMEIMLILAIHLQ